MTERSVQDNSECGHALCIDLDGTLIHTDLLFESLLIFLKSAPLKSPLLLVWLFAGRATLKRRLAQHCAIGAHALPYNEEVLAYVREQKARGRKVLLTTASDRIFAEQVAQHLEVFDDILASDGSVNLKGSLKAKGLSELLGEKQYVYAGDSRSDLKVWREASKAIVVSSNRSFIDTVEIEFETEKIIQVKKKPFVLARALRVHQWVKNLLLFVPLMMAHLVTDLQALLSVIVAFVAFSLLASAVYLCNDLMDLESDRAHRTKRNRPLASGELSIPVALALVPVLIMSSTLLALSLPKYFGVVLGVYFLLTTAYSFRLKQIAILDIVVLACLYTLRVLAGGFAAGVAVSHWLLAFSMFLFLSLACVKRYSELLALKKANVVDQLRGRGYRTEDIEMVSTFGVASGYLSVMVLALYVSSSEVGALYETPTVIWLVCPFVLYWISRVWLLTHRDEMHEDPIVFAIKDPVSYAMGLACALLLVLAAW